MKNNQKTKEKKWIFKSEETPQSNAAALTIASELGIDPIVAKLLYQRGYTDSESAKAFLYMETEVLSNPFKIKDMKEAILSIKHAIDSKHKITIYGDYDVDGVTSVCTLYLYLKSCGADVNYYIPNRSGEGYGVSCGAIEALAETGTKLIITVDTGITANEEVDFAKTLGVDFVITDHHECRQELPSALAIVNPHRLDCESTFKDLAGVGVVFKLLCAYEEFVFCKSPADAALNIFSKYADIVSIGTIADVMPIKEENRLIVSYGLKMIENTKRPGLAALIEASSGKNDAQRQNNKRKQLKITSNYIGYTLAPRLNAAGRIRTATLAVELFLSDNFNTAIDLAQQLCDANKERQAEENKIMQAAYKEIEERGYDKMPVIVLEADDWHHGVIGIVSSRITEKYSKPSILVSFEGNDPFNPSDDDVGKGSGRSIKGMNLVDALCYCNEELVRYGGHELAAGLSVTRGNIEIFRKKINEYAMQALGGESLIPSLEADLEIKLSDVNYSLAEQLRIMEPFGVGNPVPVFVLRNVNLTEISSVSEGKHTRLAFASGKNIVPGIFFSCSASSLGLFVGDSVDVLFNLDTNEWAGRKSVQLIIRDIKQNGSTKSTTRIEYERFCEIWSGTKFYESENVIPSRDDFATVYRIIVSSLRSGVEIMSVRDLIFKLGRTYDKNSFNYVKLKVIIKVMQELNIIGIEEIDEDKYKFIMYYKTGKTDLEKSNLLRRLRSQIIS